MQGDMSTLVDLMELFYGGEKGVGMMGKLMHSIMTVGADGKPKEQQAGEQREQQPSKVIGGTAAGAATTGTFYDAVKESAAEADRKQNEKVQPDMFEEAIKAEVEKFGIKEEEAAYFARVSSIMAEDVRAAVEQEPDLDKREELAHKAAAELIQARRVTYTACQEILVSGTQGLDIMFRDNREGLSLFLQQTELTTLYYQVKQAENAKDEQQLAKLNEVLRKRCEAIKSGQSFTQEEKVKQERHLMRRGR